MRGQGMAFQKMRRELEIRGEIFLSERLPKDAFAQMDPIFGEMRSFRTRALFNFDGSRGGITLILSKLGLCGRYDAVAPKSRDITKMVERVEMFRMAQ